MKIRNRSARYLEIALAVLLIYAVIYIRMESRKHTSEITSIPRNIHIRLTGIEMKNDKTSLTFYLCDGMLLSFKDHEVIDAGFVSNGDKVDVLESAFSVQHSSGDIPSIHLRFDFAKGVVPEYGKFAIRIANNHLKWYGGIDGTTELKSGDKAF